MDYVATNIRFPRETLQDLKLQAVRRHKSLASLIRDAVEQTYGSLKTRRKASKSSQDKPFAGIIGICHSGIKDGAREHDRDIYGDREWI